MLVRFRQNLGSRDAEALGLDFHQCQIGMELQCREAAAAWLLKRKVAEEVKVVKAVSPPPSIAAAKLPDIKAESKSARKSFHYDKEA